MANPVKRIVLLCTALNEVGGTSRHMAQIARHLDPARFDVFLVFASKDPGRLMEFFKQEGCDPLKIRQVACITRNPWAVFAGLRRIWRELSPDVVHSFFLHSDILSRLTTGVCPGIVRISSVEGKFIWDQVNGVGFLKNACYRFFNKRIRSGFSRTITVSADLRQEVIRAGAHPKKVGVIPVGIPVVPEAVLRPRPDDGQIVVGCLARFSPDKGVDLLVSAAASLLRQRPEVQFLIAGDGEAAEELKKQVRDAGLSERIKFVGWVRDVTGFLNSLDIVVMPSRREGCPLALIEAMMHEKAIVVFDAPGVNEVVRHNHNALMAPAFNTGALAAKIMDLVGNPELRERLGKQARRDALHAYTVSREAEAWHHTYTDVCLGKGQR